MFHGKAVEVCVAAVPPTPVISPPGRVSAGLQCGLFVQQRQRLRFSRLIFREERGAEDTQTSLAGLEAGRGISGDNRLAPTYLLQSVVIRGSLAVAATPDQRGGREWGADLFTI